MPAPARAKKTAIEEPSLEERIRRRAYELYVQRGNESGSELDDWLQAEEEIQRAEEQAVGKSRHEQREAWCSKSMTCLGSRCRTASQPEAAQRLPGSRIARGTSWLPAKGFRPKAIKPFVSQPLPEHVGAEVVTFAKLCTGFAVLALLMACVG